MLKFVVDNLFLIAFIIIPCLIIIIQWYRFFNVEAEYKDCYKDYMSLLADYGKKLQKLQTANNNNQNQSSSTTNTGKIISFSSLKIEDEKYTNDDGNKSLLIKLKKSDPYEWFIGYRNLKTELFKSYIVVPLELYFYMAFMISIIYSFGCGIQAYKDDPVRGFGNLIEAMQNNWKGALIILAIFMHRIVLKKIEDLKRFKDTEFK